MRFLGFVFGGTFTGYVIAYVLGSIFSTGLRTGHEGLYPFLGGFAGFVLGLTLAFLSDARYRRDRAAEKLKAQGYDGDRLSTNRFTFWAAVQIIIILAIIFYILHMVANTMFSGE